MTEETPKCLPECYTTSFDLPDEFPREETTHASGCPNAPKDETPKPATRDEMLEDYGPPDHQAAETDARNIVANWEPQDCDEDDLNHARAYLALRAENAALRATVERYEGLLVAMAETARESTEFHLRQTVNKTDDNDGAYRVQEAMGKARRAIEAEARAILARKGKP